MSRIGFTTDRFNHRHFQINLTTQNRKTSGDRRELSAQRNRLKRSTSKETSSVGLYHSVIEMEMKWKSIKNEMDSRENSADRNSSSRMKSLEKCKTSGVYLGDTRSNGDKSLIIPKTVPVSSITLEKKKNRDIRSQTKLPTNSNCETPQKKMRKKWGNNDSSTQLNRNDSRLKKSSYICYPHKENTSKISLSKTSNTFQPKSAKPIKVQLMPCHKEASRIRTKASPNLEERRNCNFK